MKNVILYPTLKEKVQEIKHLVKSVEGEVEDFSMGQLSRLRFTLINDYSISLIKGFGAFAGNKDNTFEMAVISPEGDLDYSLTDGDVLGHQTVDNFVELVKKVVAL